MSAALRTASLTTLAMLCFAANSLLCRAALAGGRCDPASFTLLRVVGGAVALGLLARTRSSPAPGARLAWGSALALFGYAITFSLAYRMIPAGVGALLLFAAVQITMVGAGLRNGERPRAGEWVGFALSFGGLLVLTMPGLSRPEPMGVALMLVAGVAWGVYSLRGRRSGDAVGNNAASFTRAVPMAILAGALTALVGRTQLDTRGALLALASGALTSGLGYTLWYAALPGLTATRAAIVQLVVPPLAAAGGVLVLGERISPRLGISSALILGGIALATRSHRR